MRDYPPNPTDVSANAWREELRIVLAAIAGQTLATLKPDMTPAPYSVATLRDGLAMIVRDAITLEETPECAAMDRPIKQLAAEAIAHPDAFEPADYIWAMLKTHGVDLGDERAQESVMAQVDHVLSRLHIH